MKLYCSQITNNKLCNDEAEVIVLGCTYCKEHALNIRKGSIVP